MNGMNKKVWILMVLMVCLLSINARSGPESNPVTSSVKLRVSEQPSGKVIAGAMVFIWRDADSDPEAAKTDSQGELEVKYATAKTENLFLHVTQKGFLPLLVHFADVGTHPPPHECKVTLEKGTTIGGVVQDESGQPISNVKIKLLYFEHQGSNATLILGPEEGCCLCEMLKMQPEVHGHIAPFHAPYEIKTDSKGKWLCSAFPAKGKGSLFIWFKHPDFVSDSRSRKMDDKFKNLRDLSNVETMNHGLPFSGFVLDLKGNPIKDATVVQGDDHFGTNLDYPEVKTDSTGKFAFGPCDPGEVILTVQSPNHAPDQSRIFVRDGMKPVEFRLGPAQKLTGKFVDKDGKPIPRVMIAADTWREHRSLDWKTYSDQEGRFVWSNAPPDEVKCDFIKAGFMYIRNTHLRSQAKEYVFTMYRPLQVSGHVTDAKTGQPIPSFQVVYGSTIEADHSIYWVNDAKQSCANGNYAWKTDEPSEAHYLRVDADGYDSQISRPIKMDEGRISLDFKLQRGGAATGKVVDSNGKPLDGAIIAVATKGQPLFIANGRTIGRESNVQVKSKSSGEFSLPAQIGDFSIIVLHDHGYADISSVQLKKASTITVKPWAKIEGIARNGEKYAAGGDVTISYEDPSYEQSKLFYHDFRTKADDQGRFHFDRVIPRTAFVMMGGGATRLDGRMVGSSHGVFVALVAGQTCQISLGGHGRSIVGRIKMPESGSFSFGDQLSNISMVLEQEKVPTPENMNLEERRAWYAKWQDSPAGEAYRRASRWEYMVLNKDGTFRADDILPGKYTIEVKLWEPDSGGSNTTRNFAVGKKLVEVPALAPNARGNEPLSVGTIEPVVVKIPSK